MVHFGATLRVLRAGAGLGVRELARRVGVSSAYVSRVESGDDPPPSPERLRAFAEALGVPHETLVELAGQAGPAVGRYVQDVPAAGALFLEIARRDLDAAAIARVKAFVDAEFPSAAGGGPRLAELVPPERIVIGFRGACLEDAVEAAAARLPRLPGVRPRQVVEALLGRGRTSSSLGDGVIAPHALIDQAPEAGALVALAEPIATPTADGAPVRMVVALIAPPARGCLDGLARVARLAAHGVSSEVLAATSTHEVWAAIDRVERQW